MEPVEDWRILFWTSSSMLDFPIILLNESRLKEDKRVRCSKKCVILTFVGCHTPSMYCQTRNPRGHERSTCRQLMGDKLYMQLKRFRYYWPAMILDCIEFAKDAKCISTMKNSWKCYLNSCMPPTLLAFCVMGN